METCEECHQPAGKHLTTCPYAPEPYAALIRDIRDELRMLRRLVAYGFVLVVLWMLVWALLNG